MRRRPGRCRRALARAWCSGHRPNRRPRRAPSTRTWRSDRRRDRHVVERRHFYRRGIASPPTRNLATRFDRARTITVHRDRTALDFVEPVGGSSREAGGPPILQPHTARIRTALIRFDSYASRRPLIRSSRQVVEVYARCLEYPAVRLLTRFSKCRVVRRESRPTRYTRHRGTSCNLDGGPDRACGCDNHAIHRCRDRDARPMRGKW